MEHRLPVVIIETTADQDTPIRLHGHCGNPLVRPCSLIEGQVRRSVGVQACKAFAKSAISCVEITCDKDMTGTQLNNIIDMPVQCGARKGGIRRTIGPVLS